MLLVVSIAYLVHCVPISHKHSCGQVVSAVIVNTISGPGMVHTAVPRPILWYYVITALIDNILSTMVVLAKLDLHWFEHVRNRVTQLVGLQFDFNVSRTFWMLVEIIAN